MRRLLVSVCCVLAVIGCDATPERFDVIIRGGQVYDGVSSEPQRIDVGIRGDRVTALRDLTGLSAPVEVDARGYAVAPGFIDAQSRSGITLLTDGHGESHLRQGITTSILGDRDSPAFWARQDDAAPARPFDVSIDWESLDEYSERLLQRGTSLNVATLIPFAATGGSPEVVEAAMQQGALGLAFTSTGATVDPRVVTLTRIVAAHGGVLAAHLAGSGDQAIDALEGALEVAAASQGPLVIYQPDLPDEASFARVITRIREARARGLAVSTTATSGADGLTPPRLYWLRDSEASIGTESAAMPAAGRVARNLEQMREGSAFLDLLARYVREEKRLPLGRAIRHMTSNPASQFGIAGRGLLRVGEFADVIVFDPATMGSLREDNSGHAGSHVLHVIVNGVPVLDPDGLTGARPGRVVYGSGRRGAGQTR